MKKKSVNDKGMTFIATVLDKSSSMDRLRDKAIEMVNMIHTGHNLAAIRFGVPASLSLFTFADSAQMVFENMNIGEAKVLNREDYVPQGCTAIFDGLCLAMTRLQAFGKTSPNAKDAFLINIITDGENNRQYINPTLVIAKMKELLATGKWTITFQVPKGTTQGFCRQYGVPEINVAEWEQTAEGTKDVANQQAVGTQNYMDVRSTGGTAVADYFQTNLGKVSATKVKKACDVVTPNFRVLKVASECVIKEFVESKNRGKPYLIGSAYYQLTKSEKIQGNKELLLMRKGEDVIFGGDGVRELLSIPKGLTVSVNPGNHGDYDIFVLSTSVNRKLVRGTKVLLDKTKVTNSRPTWDHNAAKEVADRKAAQLKA